MNGQSNLPESGGVCATTESCVQPIDLNLDSYASCCSNFSFDAIFVQEIPGVLDFGCYTCTGKYVG